jgi:anthranilate phosphoribosyltransferase
MQNLDRKAAAAFLGRLLDDETIPEADVAQVLTDLTQKGETTEEILGFIDAMRARMTRVKTDVPAIDVCGTGGDKSGTFNISTASAIVLAAGGVAIAKHGNRAASSKCGSADVLEALGVPVNLGPSEAAQSLQDHGFVFLFAQKYHPALKRLAMVRKKLGFPTVFNLLGPLLNPASVKRQVIGTFSKAHAKRLATIVRQLEYEHVIVLSSEDRLDEASLSAPTHLIELRDGKTQEYSIKAKDFGLKSADLSELQEGESVEQNAQIVTKVLDASQVLDAKQRVLILNAALGFYVSGQTKSIAEGVLKTKQTIQNGAAAKKLKELQS